MRNQSNLFPLLAALSGLTAFLVYLDTRKHKKEILSFIKQKDDKTKIWYEAYGSNETGTFWKDLTFDNKLDRELFR